MFLAIIAVFAIGVATGTVVDNQLDGKIGNTITFQGDKDVVGPEKNFTITK